MPAVAAPCALPPPLPPLPFPPPCANTAPVAQIAATVPQAKANFNEYFMIRLLQVRHAWVASRLNVPLTTDRLRSGGAQTAKNSAALLLPVTRRVHIACCASPCD